MSPPVTSASIEPYILSDQPGTSSLAPPTPTAPAPPPNHLVPRPLPRRSSSGASATLAGGARVGTAGFGTTRRPSAVHRGTKHHKLLAGLLHQEDDGVEVEEHDHGSRDGEARRRLGRGVGNSAGATPHLPPDTLVTWLNHAVRDAAKASKPQGDPSNSLRRRADVTPPGAAESKGCGQDDDDDYGQEDHDAAPLSLGELERGLAELSSALSFARRETWQRIDATIDEVRASVPRLGFDLRLLRDEAGKCAAQLGEVRARAGGTTRRDQPASVGNDTPNGNPHGIPSEVTAEGRGKVQGGSANAKTSPPTSHATAADALARISTLYTLRSRIGEARDVLKLAESWSTLSADVVSYLAEQKWTLAASRLEEARSSLAVFENTPEFEGRKALLAELDDQTQAALAPQLFEVLQRKEVASCQRLGEVYRSIGRRAEFTRSWTASRIDFALREWNAALQRGLVVGGGTTAGAAPDATEAARAKAMLMEPLTRLLRDLEALLNEELVYAPHVFGEAPRDALLSLASALLTGLEPPLPRALASAASAAGGTRLRLLVRAHAACRDAAEAARRVLATVRQEPPPEEVTPTRAKRASRQPQSRSASALAAAGAAKDVDLSDAPAHPGDATGLVRKVSTGSGSGGGARSTAALQRRHSRRVSLTPSAAGALGESVEAPIMTATTGSGGGGTSPLMPRSPLPVVDAVEELLSALQGALRLDAWERTMFAAFESHQRDYGALETELLLEEWRARELQNRAAAIPPPSSSLSASALATGALARRMDEDVAAATKLGEAAVGRALGFTCGLGAAGLVSALDALLARAFADARRALDDEGERAAEQARTAAAARIAAGRPSSLLDAGAMGVDGGGGGGGAGGGGGGMEADGEWRVFEAGVRLLSAAKAALGNITALEATVAARLSDVATLVLGNGRGRAAEEALRRLRNANTASAGGGNASKVDVNAPLAYLVSQGFANDVSLRATLEAIEARAGHGHGASATTLSAAPMAHSESRRTSSSMAGGVGAGNATAPTSTTMATATQPVLLSRAREALLSHVSATQRLLCDVVLAPLMPHLELYASLPAWELARLPGSVHNDYELAMPTFSLSPTETMSKVGEGMLDLPRLLEVWAEDEAVSWAVPALPAAPGGVAGHSADAATRGEAGVTTFLGDAASGSTRLRVPAGLETGAAASASASASSRLSLRVDNASTSTAMTTTTTTNNPTPSPATYSPTMERRSHRHTASVAAIATTEPSPNPHASSPKASAGAASATLARSPVVGGASEATTAATTSAEEQARRRRQLADETLQAYLATLSHLVVSHLCSAVLPSVPRLTVAGCSQLEADLEYLCTMLSALNVDADALGLAEWRWCVSLPDPEGRRLAREARISGGRKLGSGERERVRGEAFESVARMRGWTR